MENSKLQEAILDFIKTTSHPDSVDIATYFNRLPMSTVLLNLTQLEIDGKVIRHYSGLNAWYTVVD